MCFRIITWKWVGNSVQSINKRTKKKFIIFFFLPKKAVYWTHCSNEWKSIIWIKWYELDMLHYWLIHLNSLVRWKHFYRVLFYNYPIFIEFSIVIISPTHSLISHNRFFFRCCNHFGVCSRFGTQFQSLRFLVFKFFALLINIRPTNIPALSENALMSKLSLLTLSSWKNGH